MVVVTSALLAQLGLLNGCILDLNAILDLAVCPSGVSLNLPTDWATSKGDQALTLVKGALPVKRTQTPVCTTTPVTVDPLDVSLDLSVEDTVSLQVALGVLDLLNAHLDLNLDLASILDLIVKLNINLIDLVNLHLDVNVGVGRLLDALINLDLGLNVGHLLSLDLDLGIDLSPLGSLGSDVAVTLGDILNLTDCTVENVIEVVDKLLIGIAPVVDSLLIDVIGLVDSLLNTVGSLLSGLLGKRQERNDVLTAAVARRNLAARTDYVPSHPIQYQPTCGTAIKKDATGVVEVEVSSLTECVSKCHLEAAGGLIDLAVNADINVLNIVNVDLCLGLSLLGGEVTDSGKTVCRYLTGTGLETTIPSSALEPCEGAVHYVPKL